MGVQTVLREIESLLLENKQTEAEELLLQKLQEAKGNDIERLSYLNEQIKLYCEQGRVGECMKGVTEALSLVQNQEIKGSFLYGKTLLCCATAFRVCGQPTEALPLYLEAYNIYKERLHPNDYRFAGLYNELGVTYEELSQFLEAEECFKKALAIMEGLPRGEMELAVTHTNLACIYARTNKEDKVEYHRTRAKHYFNSNMIFHGGYFAYNCLKCAEQFEKLGYEEDAKELKEKARLVYEKR